MWAQRYSTSVIQGFYRKEGGHCYVGKMGGGTLTLETCAQVMYFAYHSILLTSLLISVSDKSLSTAATVAITAVFCLLVAFTTGTLCGALITVCINRWNKKGRGSKPAPNTQEQQQAAVVYEEVDTLRSQKIELKENMAYGPAKQ